MYATIIWTGTKWQLLDSRCFSTVNEAWITLGDKSAVDVIHVDLIQYLEAFGPPIEGKLDYIQQ